MKYLAVTAAMFIATSPLAARTYDYPIKGVRGEYSASFGEMRENHFHSGIDITLAFPLRGTTSHYQ